eukprot:8926933-Pyramimonas_sp.AAC.1
MVEVFHVCPLQAVPAHVPWFGEWIDATVASNTYDSNNTVPIETAGIASFWDWFGALLDPILLRVNVLLERAKDEDR